MDHSHAANKSIKHYADAKRVPTRKVTGREGLTTAAVLFYLFVFFIFLLPEEPSDSGQKRIQTRKEDRRFLISYLCSDYTV